MFNAAAEIRRCQQVLREANRAILAARIKLAVLWLPCRLGLAWTRDRALAQQDAISEWRYTREEFGQNLWRLRRYGTTLVGFCLFSDRADGYDGWLEPQDHYQEDQG